MTGEEQTEMIKEKLHEGAVMCHEKRCSTARKRRTRGSLSLYKSRK
jgi:hypothetical protein